MRGVMAVVRVLLVLVVIGVIANCADDPTAPERGVASKPTTAFATADNGNGLSITTDKDDYAPGDTVWFTGAGWTPEDSVDIVLTDDPTLDSHQWTVGIRGDGTFRDSTYVVDTEDFGVTFTLTATSRTNPHQTLTVVFTDAAPNVNGFTLNGTTFTFPPPPPSNPNATNPISVAANAVVTIDVTATTVTGTPGGANWRSTGVSYRVNGGVTFSAEVCNDVDKVTNNTVQTLSQSFTFSAAAPAVATLYDVRARAYIGDGCSGTSGVLDLRGVLQVAAVPPADASAPVVTNVTATPNPTNGSTAVVLTADVSDATTGNSNIQSAEYRIDAGSWLAMTASDGAFDEVTEAVTKTIAAGDIQALSDGEHDLCVRGTDALNNTSDGTSCTKLLVSKSDPVVTDVAATPNPGSTGNATLTAKATDLSTNITAAQYSIDGGAWTAMSAQDGSFNSKSEVVTASLTGVAEGSHQVCVRATNAASNTSDGTACITLIVDKTPPVVSGVLAVPNPGSTGSVTLTATATDALTNVTAAQYKVDGGGWTAMTAQDGSFDSKSEGLTATVSGLAEGSHQLCVRATDAVSNTSDGTSCITVLVDKTPPVVSGVSASPNPGNTGNATLTATATDALTNITTAQYRVDAGSWTAMSAQDGSFDSKSEDVTANLTGIAEGSHQVCVRATDSAANTSDGTDCITLLVDKTPPVVSGVTATPNPGKTGNATLTATATDALTNITAAQYSIDAGAWAGMTAQDGAFNSKSEGVTASLSGIAEGSHQVCVRATDAVANTSDGTACITLIVDKTPPVVTNVAASPNPVSSGSVTVTATATDALTNVTSASYTIDGGSAVAMSSQDGSFDSKSEIVTGSISSATIASLTQGSHSVCVKATDEVSNTSDGTACTTLVVDRTPPAISGFTVTPNPVPINSSFTISFSLTDALSNIKKAEYSYDNGGGRTWNTIGGPYGTKTVTVSATVPTTAPDVIEICVRGTDAADNANQINGTTNPVECQLVAVYDPSAGFVTGGGWIMSPTGAYIADPSLFGKATFGFVSKYVKGKSTPTGNTEFQFHVAKFNFSSTSYDWLVVSGYRAQYKGYGTVNGQGNYGFLLTAIDGDLGGSPSPDAFRIKIWEVASGAVVYDNQLGQSDTGDASTQISSGSVMIQTPKK